ncbi:unnamed protein product [[Candida] boidinii]|uniref:Unnamed protein product n=1 Tax=Candida boidinii TaxID=5477 RepID=A0A9W6WLD6_CANBO|nr:unnamed protein product [[Candida] boidinii]
MLHGSSNDHMFSRRPSEQLEPFLANNHSNNSVNNNINNNSNNNSNTSTNSNNNNPILRSRSNSYYFGRPRFPSLIGSTDLQNTDMESFFKRDSTTKAFLDQTQDLLDFDNQQSNSSRSNSNSYNNNPNNNSNTSTNSNNNNPILRSRSNSYYFGRPRFPSLIGSTDLQNTDMESFFKRDSTTKAFLDQTQDLLDFDNQQSNSSRSNSNSYNNNPNNNSNTSTNSNNNNPILRSRSNSYYFGRPRFPSLIGSTDLQNTDMESFFKRDSTTKAFLDQTQDLLDFDNQQTIITIQY